MANNTWLFPTGTGENRVGLGTGLESWRNGEELRLQVFLEAEFQRLHLGLSLFNQDLETLSHLQSLGITTEEESFSFISQEMDGVRALDAAASSA